MPLSFRGGLSEVSLCCSEIMCTSHSGCRYVTAKVHGRDQNFRSLGSVCQALITYNLNHKHTYITAGAHTIEKINQHFHPYYCVKFRKMVSRTPQPKTTTNLQLRRQTRERREYIHRKSLALQEQAIYQRKQQIKDLVAQGKQLPTELRKEAKELGSKDLVLDEAQQGWSDWSMIEGLN